MAIDISLLMSQLRDAFRDASRHGVEQTNLAIAGHPARITWAAGGLREAFLPSLRGLVDESGSQESNPGVSIHAWVGRGGMVPCPEIMGELARYPDKITVINDGARHLQYNPDGQIFSYIDTDLGEAYYYAADERQLPDYEICTPMRMLFNWICAMHGILMVHAAAAGRGGTGALLIGQSGAGKSTTALQCLLNGLDYLGDDYVAVDPDSLQVHHLYRGCKVMDDALLRLPAFEQYVIMRNAPRQKSVVILDETLGALVPSFRAVALVRPRVSHAAASTFAPISPLQAVSEFATSTIMQMPGTGNYMLRDLSRLCTRIPAFEMRLSTEPPEIAQSLQQFLQRHSET